MGTRWEGEGVDEKGYWTNGSTSDSPIAQVDPRYFRPTEIETLLGDPAKAKEKLDWVPTTSFEKLVAEMVCKDPTSAKRDEQVKDHGYRTMNYHE